MAKRDRAFASQIIKNTDTNLNTSDEKWSAIFGKTEDDYINRKLSNIDEKPDSEYKTTEESLKN